MATHRAETFFIITTSVLVRDYTYSYSPSDQLTHLYRSTMKVSSSSSAAHRIPPELIAEIVLDVIVSSAGKCGLSATWRP